LNGDDLRREPLAVRKATLASVLAKAAPGLRLNEHIEADGPTVFAHACKMGLEGIVSKRKDSAYRSGRSPDWLKMKNAAAPAGRKPKRTGAGEHGDKGDGQNAARCRGARCSCGCDGVHDGGAAAISLSDERRTTWRMAVRPRAVRRAAGLGETRVLKHFQEQMPYGKVLEPEAKSIKRRV
jgi:hypothetical protein